MWSCHGHHATSCSMPPSLSRSLHIRRNNRIFCSLNIVQTFGGVYNIHCNVKKGQCVLKSIFLSFTPFFWALPAPKNLSWIPRTPFFLDGDGCRLGERRSSRGEVETWTEAEGRAASGSHSLPFNLVLVTPQPKPFLTPSLASVKPPFNLLVTPQSKPFWTPSFQYFSVNPPFNLVMPVVFLIYTNQISKRGRQQCWPVSPPINLVTPHPFFQPLTRL